MGKHWFCNGFVVVLQWLRVGFFIGYVIVACWCCVAFVLVLSYFSNGLKCFCVGAVMVACWFCAAFAVTLLLFCSGCTLVLKLLCICSVKVLLHQ